MEVFVSFHNGQVCSEFFGMYLHGRTFFVKKGQRTILDVSLNEKNSKSQNL